MKFNSGYALFIAYNGSAKRGPMFFFSKFSQAHKGKCKLFEIADLLWKSLNKVFKEMLTALPNPTLQGYTAHSREGSTHIFLGKMCSVFAVCLEIEPTQFVSVSCTITFLCS